MASLLTCILDFRFNNKRINKTPPMKLLHIYKKVFIPVMFNLCIISFFVFWICTPLLNILNIQFSFIKMFIDIILSIFLIDFSFFLSHRFMHIGIFYKWSHKVHHELKDPIGFGAIYNHWFDFIFSAMLPAMFPPIILSSEYYTTLLWMILVTCNVVFVSHGGFIFNSKNHYLHHKKFNCNYGTGIYMDKLCKTQLE